MMKQRLKPAGGSAKAICAASSTSTPARLALLAALICFFSGDAALSQQTDAVTSPLAPEATTDPDNGLVEEPDEGGFFEEPDGENSDATGGWGAAFTPMREDDEAPCVYEGRGFGCDAVCLPPEIADLTALVREKQAKAEMIFSDIATSGQSCRGSGSLTPQRQSTRFAGAGSPRPGILAELLFSMARADPPNPADPDQSTDPADSVDPVVSGEDGPFPGKKFGNFRTKETSFREISQIRKIQDEMSNHGGRDNVLSMHDWATFEKNVEHVVKAMKIKNSRYAKSIFDKEMAKVLSTRGALKVQLERLEELQGKVIAELQDKEYVRFVEALDALVKKNRELEDPNSANPHDPTLALWAVASRNLVIIAKGGVQRLGLLPVTTLATLASIFGNGCEFLGWKANESEFERFRKPYMELLDLSASLAILVEQYKARVAAQELLLEKLNEEWDKEQKRRRSCRKK